jgi:hypothetical protein
MALLVAAVVVIVRLAVPALLMASPLATAIACKVSVEEIVIGPV